MINWDGILVNFDILFQAIDKLKSVYNHVNDIDLYIGGLLETPVYDSSVGPTFTHILAESFYRWKFSDRLFYEFPEAGFSSGSYLNQGETPVFPL